MAIKENTLVKVISGFYKGETGKVSRVCADGAAAIVVFTNGDMGKVYQSEIVEIGPQADQVVDVKIEIPEGAKKISRDDFDAALAEITSPEKMLASSSDPLTALTRLMTAEIVGRSVRDKIIEDQVVVITKEGFISALWSACTPVEVAKTLDNKVSGDKAVKVAITALITLEPIVGILFGAENG